MCPAASTLGAPLAPAVLTDVLGSANTHAMEVSVADLRRGRAETVTALRLHATQALAAKLGGFTAPAPTFPASPLIFDTWYANVIRRRKPRVIALNPETLVTLVMPLAPASSLAARLPDVLEASLVRRGVPAAFVSEHVDRLRGGAAILKTADRRVVGIMNDRVRWMGYFDARDDDDWEELAAHATEMPTLAVAGPGFGDTRLAIAIAEWCRTGVASMPADTLRFNYTL